MGIFCGFWAQKTVDQNGLICYNSGLVSKKESEMQYTLITAQGKIMCFYVKAVAEMYQAINGGVVITQQILSTETAQIPVDQ